MSRPLPKWRAPEDTCGKVFPGSVFYLCLFLQHSRRSESWHRVHRDYERVPLSESFILVCQDRTQHTDKKCDKTTLSYSASTRRRAHHSVTDGVCQQKNNDVLALKLCVPFHFFCALHVFKNSLRLKDTRGAYGVCCQAHTWYKALLKEALKRS